MAAPGGRAATTGTPWDGVVNRIGSADVAGARRCWAHADDTWTTMKIARRKRNKNDTILTPSLTPAPTPNSFQNLHLGLRGAPKRIEMIGQLRQFCRRQSALRSIRSNQKVIARPSRSARLLEPNRCSDAADFVKPVVRVRDDVRGHSAVPGHSRKRSDGLPHPVRELRDEAFSDCFHARLELSVRRGGLHTCFGHLRSRVE